MRLDEACAAAARMLAAAGIENPRREARLLAAHALGASNAALLDPATPMSGAVFDPLVARRAAREPMAFITGHQGFWTLDLAVSPDTLIPRADSETLIEAAITAFPDRARVRRVLDLGTGTGCLLLAALAEFPSAFGVGVDSAEGAVHLARQNAGHADAVFIAADWGACLRPDFDLILCNPPYIATGAIPGLMPEVACHEPARALDGGPTGLDAYAHLMPEAARLLAEGGFAIFELGAGQGADVLELAIRAGLDHVATNSDLSGVPRALTLRKKAVGGQSVPS